MVPLGYDHFGAGNVPVNEKNFLRGQLVQDLRECCLGKVSEDLTSWLPHLCQEPKSRHHRELETKCLRSGRKHGSEAPPGLDRQARVQVDTEVFSCIRACWPVQHALELHSPLGPTFQPRAIHQQELLRSFRSTTVPEALSRGCCLRADLRISSPTRPNHTSTSRLARRALWLRRRLSFFTSA